MNFIKKILKQTPVYSYYRKRCLVKRQRWVESKIPIFRKECDDLFKLFCSALDKENIVFWPEFGTLLGMYREGDFIPHDIDIDMAVFLRDIEKVHKALNNAGFEMIRHYVVPSEGSREECYLHKKYKTTIDVFFFSEEEEYLFCDCFNQMVNVEKKNNLNRYVPFSVRRIMFPIDTFKRFRFKEVDIYVPNNIETHLKASYGDSFMIPDPNFQPLKQDNIVVYTYDQKPAIGFLKMGYGL